MDSEKKTAALGYVSTAANVLYRLAILGALLWIGYGLQDVANAIDSIPVTVDQDADESSQSDDQPQILKPLLRGPM